MQKTTRLFLLGIVATALTAFINIAAAQDSLSGLENALKQTNWSVERTNARELILRPPGQPNNDAAVAAQNDMGKLARELEASGWKVEQEANGNLILIPDNTSLIPSSADPKSAVKSDAQTASDHAKPESVKPETVKPETVKPENVSSKEEQWQEFQEKLQQAGWTAELESDGSLRLEPPQQQTKLVEKEPVSPEVVNKQNVNKENVSNNENSFESMQHKLQQSGWRVTNNQDGSILLYPPGETIASKAAISRAPLVCPGTPLTLDISLPVNSWNEASDIAHSWLKNQDIKNVIVGKIRKVNDVYIISIVSHRPPYFLKHQIAIRNSDGAVIVLN